MMQDPDLARRKCKFSMTNDSMDILIVDHDKSLRHDALAVLEAAGHYVEVVDDGGLALRRVREEEFDLVLLDFEISGSDGLKILRKMRELKPLQLVVMVVPPDSAGQMEKARQLGVLECMEMPFGIAEIMRVLSAAHKAKRQRIDFTASNEVGSNLRMEGLASSPPHRFSSADAKTRREFEILFRAASTSASILILGESGTGKSVIAREVHQRSHLSSKPFVTVSCPSLSKDLLESALFGHMKGSFTGAIRDTWGKIHAADGGTLFLDEIGELPMEIQPKLLRLLQEREYERLGENKVREANVRVIAATNRDLAARVRSGDFREDLYYRLNVICVTVPSLRQRPADLEQFASDYLEFFALQLGREIDGFSASGRGALLDYPWPGNLRELRNAIERATILTRGSRLEAEDLPRPTAMAHHGQGQGRESLYLGIGGDHRLDEIEQAHLTKVLDWAPSLHEAASVLGIDKATLYRKRKRFGID